MSTMNKVIRTLLEELELIGMRHDELFDTEVRQRLRNAISDGYLRNVPNFMVPNDFGLYSQDANRSVQAALTRFMAEAGNASMAEGIASFKDRLNAIQNATITTTFEKNDYEDFIGHSPSSSYDENGNVIRNV